MTNLVDEKKLEEIMSRFEGSDYRYPVQDILETLSLALKVVRAARTDHRFREGQNYMNGADCELCKALAPFSQENGNVEEK